MALPEGHPSVHPAHMAPRVIYIRQNGKWAVALILALVVVVLVIYGSRRR